jgi:hypothetical protein
MVECDEPTGGAVLVNSSSKWVIAVLLFWQAAALAIPPPPGVEQFGTMRSSMERLSPFVGRWTGEYRGWTPSGQETTHIFRDARRVADVVILIEGVEENPRSVNIIDFDVLSNSYRLFRPGFQNPLDPGRGPMAHLDIVAPATFQWSRPYSGGVGGEFVALRTTVAVTEEQWREKLELVRRDGSTVVSAEYFLHRASASSAANVTE